MNIFTRTALRLALRTAAADGGELVKFLRKSGISSLKFDTEFGIIEIPTNSRSIVESFVRGDYFGLETIESFLALYSGSKVIYNIGANVGTSAVRIAASNKYDQIYCYEPDPSNFNSLKNNTAKIEKLSCNEIAVGRNLGTLNLNLNHDSVGRHSFRTDFGHGSISVKVDALDNFVVEGGFFDIFMDVEGWEIEVLFGAEKSLKNCAVCALEWNGQLHSKSQRHEVVDLLKTSGFSNFVDLDTPMVRLDFSALIEISEQKDLAFVRC